MTDEVHEPEAIEQPEADVSDADLDAAAEAPVVEEEAPTEEPELPDDGLPTDQAERSKLGAKVAKYFEKSDRLEQLLAKQAETLNHLVSLQQKQLEAEEEQMDPDEPLTLRQMQEYMQKQEQKKTQQVQQYQTDYKHTLANLDPELDEQTWGEIYGEMMTNFNVRHSENPEMDAKVNWANAKAAFYSKKAAGTTQKVPLKSEPAPTGTIREPEAEVKEAPLPKLSAEAQEFLERVRAKDGDEAANKLHRSLAEQQEPTMLTGHHSSFEIKRREKKEE